MTEIFFNRGTVQLQVLLKQLDVFHLDQEILKLLSPLITSRLIHDAYQEVTSRTLNLYTVIQVIQYRSSLYRHLQKV